MKMTKKHLTFLITGPRKSGKSTLCLDILNYVRKLNFSAGGVITLQNAERWFYLIQNEQKVRFEANNDEPSVKIGKFTISKDHLNRANQSIKDGCDSDFLFIDEIGLLEMNRRGYFPFLDMAVKRAGCNIFVIRESIVNNFIDEFGYSRDNIILRCNFSKNLPHLEQIKRKIDKEYINK